MEAAFLFLAVIQTLESPFLFLCSLKLPVSLGGFKETLLGNKWQNNG